MTLADRHVYSQWVDENDVGNTCCLAPKDDPVHIEAEFSDEPQARLETFECDECTNEVEGICSVCSAYVCGSCFNGNHEWKIHGQVHRANSKALKRPSRAAVKKVTDEQA